MLQCTLDKSFLALVSFFEGDLRNGKGWRAENMIKR